MIWLISDLHLGHRAAIKMCNRPFKDIEEMNKVLIGNINAMVSKSDTLYMLGDIAFRIPVEEANELINSIKCKKILLWGNHDKKSYDGRLFEGMYDYYQTSFEGIPVSLMHYPMLSWAKSHYGSVQLHGHIHSNGDYNREMVEQGIRRYDVGVDANGYCPVSARSVLEFMGVI